MPWQIHDAPLGTRNHKASGGTPTVVRSCGSPARPRADDAVTTMPPKSHQLRTPPASARSVATRMRRTRQRDTPAEIAIRRLVHADGLSYRIDRQPFPGIGRRADLVFARSRVAVFVDGCFWHCCPKHATWPKANGRWWKAKLLRNVARDRDTDTRLRAAGWLVVRVWEHEEPAAASRRVIRAVRRRTTD